VRAGHSSLACWRSRVRCGSVTIDPNRSADERRLTIRAVVVVAIALITLPVLHLCNHLSTRRTLAGVGGVGRFSWKRFAGDPVMVGRAVNYASRRLRLQGTTCLARSELIWLLLQIGGHQPVIRVGAGAGLGAGTLAHAWVELDELPVADAVDVAAQHPPFDRPLLERAG
jgi:hypothetical protein